VTSSSIAKAAVSATEPARPSQKEPVSCVSQAARKAPTMYSEPCAKLIMSITPNTIVRPAASRNSISPYCRPFRACSSSRVRPMGRRRPRSPGHLALLHVRVAVVAQDRLVERLVHQAAVAVAADGAHVVVLDRVLV